MLKDGIKERHIYLQKICQIFEEEKVKNMKHLKDKT